MQGVYLMPRISVVLPIYRTSQYLQELYDRLVKVLENSGHDFELIMVDDGSPDDAWRIISKLAKCDRRVKGLCLSRNFGQHPAISAGFDVADGDLIVLMDADLQDRPEDIPALLDRLDADHDVVYTVKEDSHEPFLTSVTSYIYHKVFSKITGTKVPRNIGTQRVFTRRFLEAVKLFPEKDIMFGPLMFHVGFQFATVEVPRDKRQGSRSSYSFRKRLALAINSLLSYTDLPQRFLVWFGSFVLIATVLYSIALIVQRLVSSTQAPSGLTLLSLLITVSLGATMVGLGIVGMYVFRVYQEVLRRPRCIVARRLNLDSEKTT